MLWVPHKGTLRTQSNFTPGSNSFGTTVTTGASTATKGTPAELITTTNFDVFYMRINAWNVASSAVSSRCCLDILVGASTERVLIPNLCAGEAGIWGTANSGPKSWEFPLYVPAGTRIAAQAASDRTATGIAVQIFLYGGDGSPPFRVGSKVTTYGIGTVPAATAFTPGLNGTWGSWAQVTASTTEDHFATVPSWHISNTVIGGRVLGFSAGIGAAAAERQIGEPFSFVTDTTESMGGPFDPMPIFQDIPAGSALSIRGANNGASNDTGNQGALHCVS
jgi:hypothetical protein